MLQAQKHCPSNLVQRSLGLRWLTWFCYLQREDMRDAATMSAKWVEENQMQRCGFGENQMLSPSCRSLRHSLAFTQRTIGNPFVHQSLSILNSGYLVTFLCSQMFTKETFEYHSINIVSLDK